MTWINQGWLWPFQPPWDLQEYNTASDYRLVSRLKFSEKFLANNFALTELEDNNSCPLNRGGIEDLPVENTTSNLPKVVRTKFLESDNLLFFSISRFGSFKNPFATITSMLKIKINSVTIDAKMISMSYGSNKSSQKP